MTEVRIREIKDGIFPISKLAALVPLAVSKEQEALTADIAVHGQREAIVLWNGKVVDGRCRQIALKVLGNRDIKYKELSDELTEAEVKVFVKSVNVRRNLTLTQKVITACKESLAPGSGTIDSIATSWGISSRSLRSAKYIAKHKPEMIEELFNGKSVIVNIQKGFSDPVDVSTDKISVIAKAIKIELEKGKLVIDNAEVVEWSPDSQIKTEEGKQWYASVIEEAKTNYIQYMIELANHRYKVTQPNVLGMGAFIRGPGNNGLSDITIGFTAEQVEVAQAKYDELEASK